MKTRSTLTAAGNRAVLRLWMLLAVLVALFFLSFALGRFDVPLWQVVKIVINAVLRWFSQLLSYAGISVELGLPQTWTMQQETVVLNNRMPRIALACLVGSCLATSGTAYQSVFQNPMAAPDILGASSGACFGAALAILLGLSKTQITLIAFVSSLVTVSLVYIIGQRARGAQIVNILLAGVMVSSLFSAGTSYIKLVADPNNQLPAITYWLMGSLSGARESDVKFVIWPILVGLVPLLLLRWRINLLTLGEEEASSMGINTTSLRLIVILCATFLTASAVSVSGMIGWVGLVIPHLSRKLVGNDCRYLFPSAVLFGAIFMLLVDNVSRNLLATEIPIGILTAVIGAPFFIYLMTRKERLV